ncbi:carboxymuconolactone decarboxylase family protein [Compostibacter hankyongensis]|uniref:Peroxidase-related enzyme n=1 Tax=Compostibacter hankyongensis TaxID=1007089 RepID=A0ABP8FQ25_9BACT
MKGFPVPKKEDLSPKNQQLFDEMKSTMGKVPNLYATLAYSENALDAYLNLENSIASLSKKQLEVVNLAVSQVNGCVYCLSAHSVVATMNGFTEAQIRELRQGTASFDPSLDVLARLSKSLTERRGHVDPELVNEFLAAGYTRENLVDVIMLVGDRTISNILHAVTKVPVDFPAAPALDN